MCPDTDISWTFVILSLLGVVVMAPVLAKLGEVMKHAGALTGPALSVLQFLQSAELFARGLDFAWPPTVIWACNQVAGVVKMILNAGLGADGDP